MTYGYYKGSLSSLPAHDILDNMVDIETTENFKTEEIISLIERCRNKAKVITLHPNGFLQLGLSDSINKRSNHIQLHVWDKEIQRRGSEEFQVHDHAFEIISNVLLGSIINEKYEVKSDPEGIYQMFRGDGTGQLETNHERVSCQFRCSQIIKQGNQYVIRKGEFHSSKSGSDVTATIILKKDIDMDYRTKVIIPINYRENKIEIDRTMDQYLAWSVIDKIIKQLRSLYK
jgi:hypothetical protein